MESKINHNKRTISVSLSKRNLIALLTKLDHEHSGRTIYKETEDGYMLIVQAESDEEHYGDRTPGVMHPVTETDIQAYHFPTD
jgi:hypothetical protein